MAGLIHRPGVALSRGGPVLIANPPQGQGAAFSSPLDDPDLYAWYDFNDGATTFQDSVGGMAAGSGDPCGAVDNKEGTAARDLGEATNKPTLATVGGRVCASFDDTDQLIAATVGLGSMFCVYAVVDCDVNDNTKGILGWGVNSHFRRAVAYQSYRGQESFGAAVGSGWHLLTHAKADDSNAALYQNGSVAVANYDPHGGWDAANVTAFALGDMGQGVGANAVVLVAEVVITTGAYNALMDAYLKNEWGIS